jgi:hypothetical protein
MWSYLALLVVSAAAGIKWGANHPQSPFRDLQDTVCSGARSLADKFRKKEKKPEEESGKDKSEG